MNLSIKRLIIFYLTFTATLAHAETMCLIGDCKNGVAYQVKDAPFFQTEAWYVGDFRDGKKSGCASISTGRVKYFGQVLEGSKHGEGIEVDTQKMTTRLGTWKNNRFVEARDSLDRDKLCGSIEFP